MLSVFSAFPAAVAGYLFLRAVSSPLSCHKPSQAIIEFSRRLGHKIRLPRRIGLNEGNFSLYLLCRLPPYHAGTTPAACNCVALVSAPLAPALNLPIKSTIIFIRVGRPGGRPECARIAGLPTGRRPARPLTRKLVFIRTILTLRFFRIAGFRGASGHSDREFALIRWAQCRKSDSLTIRLNGRDLFCGLWVARAAAPRSRDPQHQSRERLARPPQAATHYKESYRYLSVRPVLPRPVIPFPPERAAAGRSTSAFPWSFHPSPRRPRSPTAGIRPPANRT